MLFNCMAIEMFIAIAVVYKVIVFANIVILFCFHELLDAWVNDVVESRAFSGHCKGGAIDSVVHHADVDVGEPIWFSELIPDVLVPRNDFS